MRSPAACFALVLLIARVSDAQSPPPQEPQVGPIEILVPPPPPSGLGAVPVVTTPSPPRAYPLDTDVPSQRTLPSGLAPFVVARRAVPYDGGPIPPGTHLEERANRGIAIAGGAVFAGWWIATVVAVLLTGGAASGSTGWLFVPVLGPAIYLSTVSYPSTGTVVIFGLDSVLQGAGVITFCVGLLTHRRFLVLDGMSSSDQRGVRIAVVPFAAGAGIGASLQGTFW